MKKPSPHLKLRVLSEIDYAPGKTIRERIRQISERTFGDEQGRPWRFTWRTIENWWSRYRKDGRTVPPPKARSDKGRTRKTHASYCISFAGSDGSLGFRLLSLISLARIQPGQVSVSGS